MLGRDQQLRTQVLQLLDAVLFAIAFWLAHLCRSSWPENFLWLHWDPIDEFDRFKWPLLLVIFGGPLVLESQGFYQRPFSAPRQTTAWLLFKGCALITIGVIIVMFFFKMFTLARAVPLLFGAISFVLICLRGEFITILFKSQFAQSQVNRRVILVGSKADTSRMREDLGRKGVDTLEVVG